MDQPADIILAIENLSLGFRGLKALDGVGLSARKGETISVIGPNGAGKTCLINCITGYYRPREGCILYRGRNIIGMKPHQIARLGIGRTFQDPTTFPHMKGLDILMAGRYLHTRTSLLEGLLFFGRSRAEELASRQRVEEIVAFARIEEVRKVPVLAMTYGQRKQVEIARVMAMGPGLVLLDEPMSGLDEFMKEVVNELILDMRQRNITIILIEHDMRAVMELSDRVVVLDHGKKIAEGTPTEIMRDEQVAEAYLGGLSYEREAA
ncbi:MAG: ABC transporter ATP-binding protein [Chloroflexi bacterium]|nr:ABC transporter ATP-binding protein [Chloroflexota bacterium]